jgi:hypothetical protein
MHEHLESAIYSVLCDELSEVLARLGGSPPDGIYATNDRTAFRFVWSRYHAKLYHGEIHDVQLSTQILKLEQREETTKFDYWSLKLQEYHPDPVAQNRWDTVYKIDPYEDIDWELLARVIEALERVADTLARMG